MKECCGEKRDTRFCPVCGQELNAEPIREIFRFLDAKARVAERIKERHQDLGPGESEFHHRKRMEHHDRKIEKWKRWRDALPKLIDND